MNASERLINTEAALRATMLIGYIGSDRHVDELISQHAEAVLVNHAVTHLGDQVVIISKVCYGGNEHSDCEIRDCSCGCHLRCTDCGKVDEAIYNLAGPFDTPRLVCATCYTAHARQVVTTCEGCGGLAAYRDIAASDEYLCTECHLIAGHLVLIR
jgi:hypothetical protein